MIAELNRNNIISRPEIRDIDLKLTFYKCSTHSNSADFLALILQCAADAVFRHSLLDAVPYKIRIHNITSRVLSCRLFFIFEN
jgi:hypothetical protein